MPENVCGFIRDSDLPFRQVIATRGVQEVRELLWPPGEIIGGQAWRPTAPKERAAADTVSEAWKNLVADPGHAPDQVLGSASVLPAARILRSTDASAEALRQVLNMGRKEKAARLEN